MQRHLLASLLLLPIVSQGGDYIREFYGARELEKSGNLEAATAGMQRSFELAIADGNTDYATAAGANVCEFLYRNGKVIESGKSARTVLDALQAFPADNKTDPRLSTIFGYLERGLNAEGKLGAAWQANRAGYLTLGGGHPAATADGSSITLDHVKWLSPALRSRGWRLLERESEYLDYAGRSVEARALLDNAAVHLKAQWSRLDKNERFYGFKVLASRAMLLDFLGYEAEAIAAQRELLDLPAENEDESRQRLNLRLNLLRNLSQWEGPSEKILEEARGIAGILAADHNRDTERLIAKMELDLKESQAARDALAADAKRHAAEGYETDAAYAGRDSLIARAEHGEDNLDAEFATLLTKMRALGSKRGEPFLYREYGEYLLDRGRPAEAIPMITEALRLTRAFHWTLHEPALLHDLFNARLKAGDTDGARAVLAELEAWLKANPDAPAGRRSRALNLIALEKARLGDKDGAHAAYEQARAAAHDLPDYQKRYLTPELEKEALAEAPTAPLPPATEAPQVRLQPVEVHSIAAPGQAARTRFVAFNPAATATHGELVIEGPGAEASGNKLHFHAGSPVKALKIPQTISGGGESVLPVTIAANEGVTESQVKLSWTSAGNSIPASTWSIRWTSDAKETVVLDASLLEANPFRSVSLFHEIGMPVGQAAAIPFRLRSKSALRFEYYDSRSGELLAIDANGNGDFTEAGDLHMSSMDGVAAAILPRGPGKDLPGVEVRIFSPNGEALPFVSPALPLQSEVYRDGEWITEADNLLR
ncbi:hypothetical protein [Haloferula sp. BvORR071]|uniref:hypothetical protein n=1 Tax=Haloferula sp. BvORR071 TaxID=1396141 RepID=UPI0005517E5C|nr:hypothetical protein [Haloferula sp. BvORR071]